MSGVEFKGADAFISKLADRHARMSAAANSAVVVGVLGSAGSDLVVIAAANEYGTDRIPSRPFLRTAMADPRIAETARKEAALYYAGKHQLDMALDRIGAVAQGAIQRRIASNIQPANAPSTIRQKGSSHTLINTGRLRQSIAWMVRHGSEADMSDGVDINSVSAGSGLSKKETNQLRRQARAKDKQARAREKFFKGVHGKFKPVQKGFKKAATKTKRFATKQARTVKKSVKRSAKTFSKHFRGKKR